MWGTADPGQDPSLAEHLVLCLFTGLWVFGRTAVKSHCNSSRTQEASEHIPIVNTQRYLNHHGEMDAGAPRRAPSQNICFGLTVFFWQ